MHFASFLSGGFTTMAVINPPERKLAKRTSVHCTETFQVVNRTYNAEQFHQKVDKVVTHGLDFFYLFAMIGSAQGR